MCQSCEDNDPIFASDGSIPVEPMLGDKRSPAGFGFGEKREDIGEKDEEDDEEEIEPSVLVEEGPIRPSVLSPITTRVDEDSLVEDVRSCDEITELIVRVREQWEHVHDDELPRIRDLKKRNELLMSQRTQLEEEVDQVIINIIMNTNTFIPDCSFKQYMSVLIHGCVCVFLPPADQKNCGNDDFII
jgi:hypothetical protein